MSKVAKGKGKSRSEVGKSETVLKSKTTNPRTAFQIRGDWWTLSLSMFLYKGLYKEKETSLLTLCMANFGLTATSLFEIWTPAWSSASTSRFHKGICFFSLTEFFILFLFFNQGLSSAPDFSRSTELPCVNFVKCTMQAKCGNKMKIESWRKRLPRKFPQGIRPGPWLWHLDLLTFIRKYVFSN